MVMLAGHLRARGSHVRNVASFVIARLAAIILYIVPVPRFIAGQGAAAYGSLTLLLLIFGYLHVFDLGIGYAVNQRFARALARGSQRGISVVQHALPVFVTFSIIVATIVFFGAHEIARFLIGAPDRVGSVRALALAVGFLMLSALMTAVLQAYNRVDWINYSRLIIDVARAGGIFAGAFARDGVGVAVGVTITGSVVKTLVDFGLVARLLGPSAVFAPRVKWRELVINVRLGFPMLVSVLLGMMMTSMDRVVVGRLFGQKALAHYAVGADVCARAYFLVWAVTGSVYTLYVRRRAVRRTADDLIRVSLISVGVVALSFYLPLAIFAPRIIKLWISSAFAQESAGVTRIWAVTAIAYLVMSVYYNHLQGFGRPRTLVLSSTLAIAVAAAGIIVLPHWFGIKGVAIAMLTGFLAQAILLWSVSRRISAVA